MRKCMASTDPSFASSIDLSAWDAADTSVLTDYLSSLIDGNTTVPVVNVGQAPNDGLKIKLPSLSTIKPGDTISVWIRALSTYATMALLPYDASGTVATGNKLTVSAVIGKNKFTLTQAWIDDLFNQGGGVWAARIVEDSGISGHSTLAEVDSDITVEGGGGSPGGTPGNAPVNYKYLKNNRLNLNRSLAIYPQGQRQWNAFIQELQKWIKDETGTFDISSSDDAKFTGFSTDPTTSSIWWHRYGQMVHMEFNIGTGTSDATDFTITGIPTVIRPRDDCTYPLYGLFDNGAVIADRGSVKVAADGTLTFFTDHSDGAWTGGATVKGFETSKGAKALMYSLRNPPKQ